MKSILDPTFKYTNSANTNLKALFKKLRREQHAAEERERNQRVDVVEIKRKVTK